MGMPLAKLAERFVTSDEGKSKNEVVVGETIEGRESIMIRQSWGMRGNPEGSLKILFCDSPGALREISFLEFAAHFVKYTRQ